MKAIETKWKGYRFRSRLEARWAVFFDAAGIKWEYECEGYDLGENGWYLPDFVMLHNPGRGPIVEIKPFWSDEDYQKLEDVCAMARDGAGAYGAFICGAPGKEKWASIHKDGFRSFEEENTNIIEYLSTGAQRGNNYSACVDASRGARFERKGQTNGR